MTRPFAAPWSDFLRRDLTTQVGIRREAKRGRIFTVTEIGRSLRIESGNFDPHRGRSVQKPGRLMPPTTQNSRLEGVLTELGCPHDIAPSDSSWFAQRTGELIAHAATKLRGTPEPGQFEAQKNRPPTPASPRHSLVLKKLSQEVSMTHPDPYNDRISNPGDPWNREWGTRGMLIGIVAIVIMAVIVRLRGNSIPATNTATGPSSSYLAAHHYRARWRTGT